MNKRLAVLALGAGLFAMPSIAAAQAAPDAAASPSGMAPMKPPANSATMLCRPATASEKPNAAMGSQPLVCKSMTMSGGMMMIPDAKAMKSSNDTDRAWRDWLTQSLVVPTGGTG